MAPQLTDGGDYWWNIQRGNYTFVGSPLGRPSFNIMLLVFITMAD
jgi:hypothetical protein